MIALHDRDKPKTRAYHELPSGILFEIDLSQEAIQTSATPIRKIEDHLFEPLQDFLSSQSAFHFNCKPENQEYASCPLFRLNHNTEKSILSDSSKEELYRLLCIKLQTEIDGFIEKLSDSVRKRVVSRTLCRNCSVRDDCRGHTKVAVLFSGGVDSLLVAALCHLTLDDANEGIDLLNVAFAETRDKPFSVPDRELGLKAFRVLKTLYPERRWNFVRMDVAKEELTRIRQERVAPLLLPCRTVLDDSLGCAMWFGARGRGSCIETEENTRDHKIYESPAKIVLLGSGADELLGGYTRHRGRFENEGLSGLVDELEMELHRISNRNLGRDDRICSDHGRESRLPFLDESLIIFLNSLPISTKTDLTLPRGVGEKLLIRLALWKLGFQDLSFTAKRAMQFGSRIAKLESRTERADQICERL